MVRISKDSGNVDSGMRPLVKIILKSFVIQYKVFCKNRISDCLSVFKQNFCTEASNPPAILRGVSEFARWMTLQACIQS